MSAVAEWARWLNDAHNINISILYDPLDQRRFLRGLWTTIYLSVVCIVLSVAIGIVGAWVQGARYRVVRGAMRVYIEAFRNTPPLVQLLFFYFAIGTLTPVVQGPGGSAEPLVSNIGWAIISFSLFAGAYNIEIFRSGIEAVPSAMREAAESLGYTRWQTYLRIVFPLAFRISLPALNNNLVNLVKTTTLAYAIAVPEMLYASAQIWSEALNVREMMNVLLISYILIIAVLVGGLEWLERRLRIPGYSV